MKRSDVNVIVRDAIQFLDAHNFKLPLWAYWTLDEWKQNAKNCTYIFRAKLGWDVTDSGKNFDSHGLTLFTIRNGIVRQKTHPYCEKIIFMKVGQVCPYHFHKNKIEDIINRSGGDLAFRFAHATKSYMISNEALTIAIDGIRTSIKAKEEVILINGQSLTIEPYCYHTFYPVGDSVLIGEVSTISDDNNDNFFLDDVSRFPRIEEDESIQYPLVNDYSLLQG